MSPRESSASRMKYCFPRVSGDEPLLAALPNQLVQGFPRVSGDEP